MAVPTTTSAARPYTATAASLVAAVVAIGCGARSSLEGDGAGGAAGGAAPGGAGPGGAGGTAGEGGQGGSPVPCEALAWAGEPAYVTSTVLTLGPEPNLALLRTDEAQVTLAYARHVPQQQFTQAITTTTFDPWGSWPPAFGPDRDHLATPLDENIALAASSPGFFLQAGRDATDLMNVQASEVQGDTMLTTILPQVSGRPHAIAEGPTDRLLIHGAPTTALATLLPSDGGPTLLGTLGCGDGPVVAAVASLRERVFLVASSADAPFDDCLDPDLPGPPTTLHVHRVDGLTVTQGMSVTLASPLERVQLVRDAEDGAWLLYRAAGDPELHIERLDDTGMPVWSFSTSGNALYGDAVDDWSTGFVHLNTWPGSPDNETPPFVWLSVHDPAFVSQATSFDFTIELPFPFGVERASPAVLTAPDERSFLVAWLNDSATIGLLRADCL